MVVEVVVVGAGAVDDDLIELDVGLHLLWDFVLVLVLVVLTVVVVVVGTTHLPFKAVP